MGSSSSPPSKAAASSPTPAAQPRPGDLLKHAREQRGLSLAQLASLTKIPQRHLEAIESGNLAAVPGDFYRRAEIRTYARAVNVDQRLALASFEQAMAAASAAKIAPQPAARKPAPSPTFRLSPRARAWVAFGVVSCAAVLGFFMRGDGPAASSARSAPASVAPVTADSQTSQAVGSGDSRSPAPVAVGTSQTTAASPVTPQADAAAVVPASPADEPAAPPAAIDPTVTLIINTEPQGARVTVNGIGWGATPVTIRHLDAGEKLVRVSHDGYEASERVVRLEDGQRRTLTIRLRQAP
jgi:cytoskeletal protein RodZ